MDETSHLTVILDLSPTQWHLSGQSSNPSPLKLSTALAQILVFLNSHIATKHENTLAVIGALPGKRYVHLHNWRSFGVMHGLMDGVKSTV